MAESNSKTVLSIRSAGKNPDLVSESEIDLLNRELRYAKGIVETCRMAASTGQPQAGSTLSDALDCAWELLNSVQGRVADLDAQQPVRGSLRAVSALQA